MKTKPILFQGDMVRAILNGSKTQTRRPVKDLHSSTSGMEHAHGEIWEAFAGDEPNGFERCPYGEPGTLLWVRETFCVSEKAGRVRYKATDGEALKYENYKPSIHMPRWASRLTLEPTDVRVERVRAISEDDAAAEGLSVFNEDGNLWYSGVSSDPDTWFSEPWKWHIDPRDAFCELWDSINFDRGFGWASDPWVWVIEFRAIHDNVDNVLRQREAT